MIGMDVVLCVKRASLIVNGISVIAFSMGRIAMPNVVLNVSTKDLDTVSNLD